MSKAGKFIQEHTKKCSNVCSYNSLECEIPWLTPDQARKAVKIAREEIYEWLEENAVNFVGFTDYEHTPIDDTKAFYDTESLIYWLKQAIKDE